MPGAVAFEQAERHEQYDGDEEITEHGDDRDEQAEQDLTT